MPCQAGWEIIWSRWDNNASPPQMSWDWPDDGGPANTDCHIRTGSCIRLDQEPWRGRSMIMTQSQMVSLARLFHLQTPPRVDWLSPILTTDSTLTWNSGSNKKLNWFISNFLMPKLDLSPSLELLMPSQFHQISKYLIQKLNVKFTIRRYKGSDFMKLVLIRSRPGLGKSYQFQRHSMPAWLSEI